MLFVYHPKILHKHCFQFLLGPFQLPRETEDNAYAKSIMVCYGIFWSGQFARLQTLSRLLHLVYFVKYWQMFLELNSKGLYQSSGKEKQSCCLLFGSSTNREFRHFHVVVVQQRLRNVQKKRDARAKLLFC